MLIYAIQCELCNDIIFSRARHDCCLCSCENCHIDGGFDYLKIGYKEPRYHRVCLETDLTQKELFDDWNLMKDEFGLIKEEDIPKVKKFFTIKTQ